MNRDIYPPVGIVISTITFGRNIARTLAISSAHVLSDNDNLF